MVTQKNFIQEIVISEFRILGLTGSSCLLCHEREAKAREILPSNSCLEKVILASAPRTLRLTLECRSIIVVLGTTRIA